MRVGVGVRVRVRVGVRVGVRVRVRVMSNELRVTIEELRLRTELGFERAPKVTENK